MANYLTKKMEQKIEVCLTTAKMMAEVEGKKDVADFSFFDAAYWTGYYKAIEQMKRILSGKE